MPDDFNLSDEERNAILAYRKDREPKRAGKLRGTDESGAEFEIDLTPEETARLAAKHLKGLFTSDDDDQGGKKDEPKKPTPLKEYFGKKSAAS